MALSFDPQTLPVLGRDDHLPPVGALELETEALRRRFLAPPAWTPEIWNEGRLSDRPPALAAVLIGLVAHAEGPHVILTRRTDHLSAHPGQIAFPGGRVEPFDADAAATALREAHEEIGLEPSYVDVLGALPSYTTGTGFVVTPVVGVVRPGFELQAQASEVAEVFEVPLAYLMTPANHQRHAVEFGGSRREFLAMPYQARGPDGTPRRYFIWGATAAMLRNLYGFLAAT